MKSRLAACASLFVLAAAAQASAEAAAEAAPQGVTAIEEVVVTGEKFGRTLQETATSVGNLGADQIAASTMMTGRDAFEQLVNVNTAGADGRFAIRGVAFDQVTGAGFGALGVIYVDNVRMSDKSTRYGPDLLWDIESVQVLRGAQSTLQGRNALAGAIYIKSLDPTFDWQAKARAIVSNGNGQDYAAAVGGPLIGDKLAFRLSAERHKSDGFLDNPILHSDRVDFADDTQLRGKLLFQPTDDLTIRLVVNHADVKRRDAPSDTRALGGDGFLPPNPALGPDFERGLAGVAAADRRVTYVDIPEFDHNKTTAGALIADWRLNPALTLTSETTVEFADNLKQRDDDAGYFKYAYPATSIPVVNPYHIGNFARVAGGVAPLAPIDQQHERYRIFSQELRAKYDVGPLRVLGGLYYTRETEREDNFTLLVFRNVRPLVVSTAVGFKVPVPQANLLASFYSQDVPLYTFNAQPVDVENYAAYGEAEYDVNDRLTLNFGLRYDHEQNTSGVVNSGEVLGLADPVALGKINATLGALAAGINAALDPFVEASSSSTQTFHAWLPKAGVRYRLNDDVTIGAVVQRAYRAGGVSVNVVRQLVTPLLPEYTWNYELYLRTELFDKRARFNANAYYVDWTDQQAVIDLSTRESDSIGANAGHSRLYGFELQFDADVTANLKAYAALGYSHTEFVDFNVVVPPAAAVLGVAIDPAKLDALEGKSFAYAPEWSLVVGGSWRGDSSTFASFNVNYQGKSYADTANSRENSPRTLVNLRIGHDFGKVTAAVFARNLLDETYVKDASAPRPLLGEPRIAGVSLEARY
jgi:outer membrane receptor protein involved in Fe transport